MTYEVRGLATTGPWIAVANETATGASRVDYVVFDPSGAVLQSSNADAFVGHYGMPGTIAVAETGHVFLNVFASLADADETHHPFLVTLFPW